MTYTDAMQSIRQLEGAQSADALAYESVPVRVSRGRRIEHLLNEARPAPRKAHSRDVHTAEALLHTLHNADPLPGTREHYLARCYGNVLLPTGANDLCPKCGLTRSCRCGEFKNGRRILPAPTTRKTEDV